MNILKQFVAGLGQQNAPFGFAPDDPNASYRQGLSYIGDIGAGLMANNQPGVSPWANLGASLQQAKATSADRNRQQYTAQQLMEEAAARKAEREQAAQQQQWMEEQIAQLPPDQQALAKMMPDKFFGAQIEQRFAKPDLTSDMKNFRLAQNDPAYAAWLEKNKDGVTINMPGENAFEKKAAEAQANRFDTYISEGDKAVQMKGDIEALRDISKVINTGKGAQVINALGPYAEAVGIDISGLGETQAFEAITARLAPSLRTPGVGASSDFDAKQFLRSLPALANDPQGNQIISETLDAVANYKIAAADIASAAIRGEIDRREAEKQIRALPDPWTTWKKIKKRYVTSSAPTPPGMADQAGKSDFRGRSAADMSSEEIDSWLKRSVD